jgi:hypothetical protein
MAERWLHALIIRDIVDQWTDIDIRPAKKHDASHTKWQAPALPVCRELQHRETP